MNKESVDVKRRSDVSEKIISVTETTIVVITGTKDATIAVSCSLILLLVHFAARLKCKVLVLLRRNAWLYC